MAVVPLTPDTILTPDSILTPDGLFTPDVVVVSAYSRDGEVARLDIGSIPEQDISTRLPRQDAPVFGL